MFTCEVNELNASNELRSCFVICKGSLGMDACGHFEDQLPDILKAMKSVEFDFAGVEQIDTEGAALLLKLVKSLIVKKIDVRIRGMSPLPMISLLLLRIPDQIGSKLFEN